MNKPILFKKLRFLKPQLSHLWFRLYEGLLAAPAARHKGGYAMQNDFPVVLSEPSYRVLTPLHV